jgi:regulatory protein
MTGHKPMEKTITQLEIQKKNKKRVSVYLDDSYAFSLSVFSAALLSTGQVLDNDRIEELKKNDERERAYAHAIRFLGFRARSVDEIRQHLKGKKISGPVIEITLSRLIQEKYVNDQEFSDMWIDSRSRFNPKGAWALRKELQDKGVEEDIIDEGLGRYNEVDAAYTLVLKKTEHWNNLDSVQLRKKIYTFLSQRGFSYETTREVTDRVFAQHNLDSSHE